MFTGEGIENDCASFNTTPPNLLTALVILLGSKTVPLPLSGPGNALKSPTVLRPLLLTLSNGDNRTQSFGSQLK